MAARYILHPGPVTSAVGGDIMFVGARRLARLYGVRLSDCVVYAPDCPHALPADAVHLWPCQAGVYSLPQVRA